MRAPASPRPPPQPRPQKLGPDSEDHTADGVRAISISTLYLISTTVDRMSDVSACLPRGLRLGSPGRLATRPGHLTARCPLTSWPRDS